MNVAVLNYAPQSQTASASLLGQAALSARFRSLLNVTVNPIISQPDSFSERLSTALKETQAAIRARRDYLGEEQTNSLLARAIGIFDAEEWPEGEPLPDELSITSTMRAVASIGGNPSLGISADGNLTATWQEPDYSLNIEGTATGKLKWAYAFEGPDDFLLLGQDQSDLSEVLEAIQGQ